METLETFTCLRCGHSFQDKHDPKVPKERACPKCNSNSIRLVKEKKSAN
jgi:DNA-directed RNA polymerase subunit RPC12/RpoP